MGIIDSTSATLTCPTCGACDVIRAVQKGSSYGASWRPFSDSSKFSVVSERGFDGPEVKSATCKACGVVATVGP